MNVYPYEKRKRDYYAPGSPFMIASEAARVRFISKYWERDFSKGGKLNLCNLDVVKSLWGEMYPDSEGVPHITKITNFFRDRHIEYMYRLKAEGKAPFSLLDLGFRAETVNKYWDNRELAERIVGHKLP